MHNPGYGGEEFAVILPNTSCQASTLVAERLRRAVEQGPWAQRSVTVSIGAATANVPAGSPSFVKEADRALYQAKDSGRNRVFHAGQLRAS